MKIVILGSCGSGKTTLAKKLSETHGIPHIEIDALHWRPNWQRVPEEEFKANVKKALDQESWIVDGNYSKLRDAIWPKAELAIWLDFPFPLLLLRVMRRTRKNIQAKKELYSGCYETIQRQFFSRESIFYFLTKGYLKKKRTYPQLFPKYPNLRVIHLKHPRELENLSGKLSVNI